MAVPVITVDDDVVGTSIVLDRFPEITSDLLAHVMNNAGHTGHDMGGMR